MKQKKLISALLALTCVVGMGSCGGGGRTETAAPSSETSAPAEASTTTPPATMNEEDKEAIAAIQPSGEKLKNGTVKFLSSWDLNPKDGKPKEAPLEMFETQYGGKIELIACSWDGRYDALGKLVAAGDSPDMFSAADLDCFPRGAINNMFIPLDPYVDFDSDLWKPVKELNDLFVFDGKHYAGVTSTDCGVIMIYNKKTIEENGLPDPAKLLEEDNWTWDTFYDMMLKFCNREQEKYGIDGWWFEGAFTLTSGVPYIGMKDGKVVQNLDDPMITAVQDYFLKIKREDFPIPKSEYGWMIQPERVATGKTLFYPIGIYSLTESDYFEKHFYGEIGDVMFVPMPRCPQADAYYLPTAITGYNIPSGAKNPEGVAAYLDCLMICRDNETVNEIAKKQYYEDYQWTDEMWEMREKVKALTEQHPVIEFYNAVNDDVADLINNPIKETYNAGVPWAQTKDEIKLAVQSELDRANNKLTD